MKSSFQFISYKVDHVSFNVLRNIGLLEMAGTIDPNAWRYSLAFRPPLFSKNAKKYIGGLDLGVYLLNDESRPENVIINREDVKNPLIDLQVGIAGIFATEEKFEKKTEENLVRIQIPALLLPYLRSTITSLLASGGYGSVVFPLFNIHEMASQTIGAIEIKIID